MSDDLSPGSIVWAKFDEYPFWPARIANPEVTEQLRAHKKRDGIAVLFFEDEPTYALVDREDVKEFSSHYEEYAKASSDPDFLKAVKTAENKPDFEDPPLVIFHRSRGQQGNESDDEEEEDTASDETDEDEAL